MRKCYNLIKGDTSLENSFLQNLHLRSLGKEPEIELVLSGFSMVYRVFDSTVVINRPAEHDFFHVLKRSFANPFIEIYASDRRRMLNTRNYLGGINLDGLLEEAGGEENVR